MLQQAPDTSNSEPSQNIHSEPIRTIGNSEWVKKILRESIYVDICEAEKTLSHKDIILDGIDYTVHWRSGIDQGKKKRKVKDRIAFNAASGPSKGRKRKK